jgi:hypothetical protein
MDVSDSFMRRENLLSRLLEQDQSGDLLNADFSKALGGAIDNVQTRNETHVRRIAAVGAARPRQRLEPRE